MPEFFFCVCCKKAERRGASQTEKKRAQSYSDAFLLSVLVSFLLCSFFLKCPDKSSLGEKGFILAHSPVSRPLLLSHSCRNSTSGHIAPQLGEGELRAASACLAPFPFPLTHLARESELSTGGKTILQTCLRPVLGVVLDSVESVSLTITVSFLPGRRLDILRHKCLIL